MKRKTVALYDPYLDVMGGGEKHILSIIKVLQEEGYEVTIFWDQDLSKEIAHILDIPFERPLTFTKNIFKDSSVVQKYSSLSKFNIFFYVTDGSYFLSGAKKNYIFSMVPNPSLYRMSLINKLKTANVQFISNSQFTQSQLSRWGITSEYIYPYIENTLLDIDIQQTHKEKIILSVGRFFKHLHSKRQDIMIDMFKKLKQENDEIKDFRLILAGGLKEEDKDYFKDLGNKITDEDGIILKPNVSYQEKIELYKKSALYWHFAGYGIDENKNPDLVEHLGITPLEAMSGGCIDFCYRAGGLKEIITDGTNGYLFNSYEELKEKTSTFLEKSDHSAMQQEAKKSVLEKFSYDVFKKRVKEVILK
jgi:glycosyltransferase involved in cell wall biosynthesis